MSQPRHQLLLWDIDGTLINSGHAGEFAIIRAAQKVLHLQMENLDQIDYRGRTDRRIAANVCKLAGVEATDERLHDLVEAYLEALEDELPKRKGERCPGVIDVIERAAETPWLEQGLLTGNMKRGAELKLSHYDSWHYFEFGAFADDSIERNDLGAHAVQRAADVLGTSYQPDAVIVIGDTVHDINCGKAIGAATVAVATGSSPVADLSTHHPDLALEDFSDVDGFFDWLAQR